MKKSLQIGIYITLISLFLVSSAQANPLLVWGPRVLNTVGTAMLIVDVVNAKTKEEELRYKKCEKRVYSYNLDWEKISSKVLIDMCVKNERLKEEEGIE